MQNQPVHHSDACERASHAFSTPACTSLAAAPMTHGRKKSIRASTGVQTSAEVAQYTPVVNGRMETSSRLKRPSQLPAFCVNP